MSPLDRGLRESELQSFWATLKEIMKQAEKSLLKIRGEEVEAFIESLLSLRNGKKLFVIGAGRSGLIGKAFAMRIMQLGFNAYVVGETITPALEKGDLLVAVSGSGRTRIVVEIARMAKKLGAQVIAITSNRRSPLGRVSTLLVKVSGKVKPLVRDSKYLSRSPKEHISTPPLGTQFEINCMIFFDAIVSELMRKMKIREEDLLRRHANLE